MTRSHRTGRGMMAGILGVLIPLGLAGCGRPGGNVGGTPGLGDRAQGAEGGERLTGSQNFGIALAGVLNSNGGRLQKVVNDVLQIKHWAKEDLPNFYQVDARVYRGGQPRPEDGWQRLQRLGIRTVINLRLEDDSEVTSGTVARYGMRPVYIPMPDTGTPTREQVRQFRQVLADPASGRIYVHCSAGLFRTSTMIGVHEIDSGKNVEEVLASMKEKGWKPNFLASSTEEKFLRSYAADPAAWR